MTTTEPVGYGIGACLNCRHLFLSTPTYRECPLCGFEPKLPLLLLPEAAAEPPAAEGYSPGVFPVPPGVMEALGEVGRQHAEGVEETPMWFEEDVTCPCCGRDLIVHVGTEGVELSAHRRPAAEDEPPSGEEQLPAEGAPPPIEEGAAEPEGPAPVEEPSSEAAAAATTVKDDTAALPPDDTPSVA